MATITRDEIRTPSDFEEYLGSEEYPRPERCSFYIKDQKNYTFVIDHVCHAMVRSDSTLTEVVTYLKNTGDSLNYTQYLLNSKWLGDCFITKDAEEGYKSGFHMNTSTPLNLLRAALIVLRTPHEIPRVGFDYNRFKQLGWKDLDCLYFSLVLKVVKGDDVWKIQPSMKEHGKCVDSHLRYEDVRDGIHYNLTLPANLDGRSKNYLGMVDKSLVGNPSYLIENTLENHPSRRKEKNPFGRVVEYLPYTQENMRILRSEFHKKRKERDESLH